MPVFISYCHEDKDFIDKLAAYLCKARSHVWIDRWELHVGDSIVTKIEAAIQEASALIVVLSEASIASEWCRKEINAGLVRELEERRVIVLPLLLEDCEVPLFLREKMYADFRRNFDEGLRQVLEAIAKVTSDTLGRVEQPGGYVDWGIECGEVEDRLFLCLAAVEWAEDKPYTVLTEVTIVANEQATRRYKQYEAAGLEHFGRQVLLETLRGSEEFASCQILITDDSTQTLELELHDPRTGVGLHVELACRRLGEDTGRDILVNVGTQVSGIIEQIHRTLKPLSADESKKILEILARPSA
jgi:hypothetical protein